MSRRNLCPFCSRSNINAPHAFDFQKDCLQSLDVQKPAYPKHTPVDLSSAATFYYLLKLYFLRSKDPDAESLMILALISMKECEMVLIQVFIDEIPNGPL